MGQVETLHIDKNGLIHTYALNDTCGRHGYCGSSWGTLRDPNQIRYLQFSVRGVSVHASKGVDHWRTDPLDSNLLTVSVPDDSEWATNPPPEGSICSDLTKEEKLQ